MATNFNTRKVLEDAIRRKREATSSGDIQAIAREVSKEISAKLPADKISNQIVGALEQALSPLLQKILERDQISASAIQNAIETALSRVRVDVPEVRLPTINVPRPEVTVNVPRIDVPAVNMPSEMDVKGWIGFMGYDRGLLNDPLPVQLRDANGKPVNLFENLTALVGGGGGGGKHDYFTIKGFSQSAYAELTNADGRLKVSVESGGSGLTDTELRASAVPVAQVSGASWSTEVKGIFGTSFTGSEFVNSDNRLRVSVETGASGLTDAELRATSVPVSQVSGANWSTEVTNTVTVTGSLTSTVAVGDIPSDTADTGSAPIKTGGIARTANPTAVANGDRVSTSYDDVGRQLMRPVQARDLIQTAYAQLTNGTETTLRAAVAGAFLDLIYIMGANNSDAAVSVDLRAVTAGGVMMTLQIPANGTAGIACPVPLPQQETGNNWTADMGDITGTTVSLSALFSQEV